MENKSLMCVNAGDNDYLSDNEFTAVNALLYDCGNKNSRNIPEIASAFKAACVLDDFYAALSAGADEKAAAADEKAADNIIYAAGATDREIGAAVYASMILDDFRAAVVAVNPVHVNGTTQQDEQYYNVVAAADEKAAAEKKVKTSFPFAHLVRLAGDVFTGGAFKLSAVKRGDSDGDFYVPVLQNLGITAANIALRRARNVGRTIGGEVSSSVDSAAENTEDAADWLTTQNKPAAASPNSIDKINDLSVGSKYCAALFRWQMQYYNCIDSLRGKIAAAEKARNKYARFASQAKKRVCDTGAVNVRDLRAIKISDFAAAQCAAAAEKFRAVIRGLEDKFLIGVCFPDSADIIIGGIVSTYEEYILSLKRGGRFGLEEEYTENVRTKKVIIGDLPNDLADLYRGRNTCAISKIINSASAEIREHSGQNRDNKFIYINVPVFDSIQNTFDEIYYRAGIYSDIGGAVVDRGLSSVPGAPRGLSSSMHGIYTAAENDITYFYDMCRKMDLTDFEILCLRAGYSAAADYENETTGYRAIAKAINNKAGKNLVDKDNIKNAFRAIRRKAVKCGFTSFRAENAEKSNRPAPQKINVFSATDGAFIMSCPSISAAAAALDIDKGGISMVVRGKRSTFKGYVFRAACVVEEVKSLPSARRVNELNACRASISAKIAVMEEQKAKTAAAAAAYDEKKAAEKAAAAAGIDSARRRIADYYNQIQYDFEQIIN